MAVAGKVAVIMVSDSTVKEVASTVLRVTEVVPVKSIPVISTKMAELLQASVGVKLVIDWA
ncbi:hypothetical protein D3C71_2113830 [compost metagenome]